MLLDSLTTSPIFEQLRSILFLFLLVVWWFFLRRSLRFGLGMRRFPFGWRCCWFSFCLRGWLWRGSCLLALRWFSRFWRRRLWFGLLRTRSIRFCGSWLSIWRRPRGSGFGLWLRWSRPRLSWPSLNRPGLNRLVRLSRRSRLRLGAIRLRWPRTRNRTRRYCRCNRFARGNGLGRC